MARPRQRPRRLAEKLLRIRQALGLSQNEMISRLGFSGELIQAHISAYERQRQNRVPPLGVVLQYARCAGVAMEVIVDDSLDLPDDLLTTPVPRPTRKGVSEASQIGGKEGRKAR